jgi:hypothetical protein
MHIPILTSKLDFFAWDESVTSLLRAHGLLGHILDPTETLNLMRPDWVHFTRYSHVQGSGGIDYLVG